MEGFYTPNNNPEAEAAAFAAGEICRVGGLALTHRALELCGLKPPALLADIGCGQGATVRYLRAAGFQAFGLDCQPTVLQQASEYCRLGRATALPYTQASLDGLLFECSLSQVQDKKLALAEAQRVLKTAGQIIISDMYARNKTPQAGNGPLSRGTWLGLLEEAGFHVHLFEDHSEDMKNLTAQLLWQYGQQAWPALCGYNCSLETLKASRCGYFLLLAKKPKLKQ